MRTFAAADGTRLAYHVLGQGNPVIVLPGGPMQDSAYLGDLGGLSERLRLIRLDLRATGDSARPTDLTTCRCDRLVDDVETLRVHLGLERVDLIAHSAGTNLAALYAARHPERVGKLALITPSTYAVGITATPAHRRAVIERRRGEPWFEQVSAAFESIAAGQGAADDWDAIVPFTYGRWDTTAQAHHAAGRHNPDAAAAFTAEGAFDPATTRTALATLDAPVLVVAGDHDLSAPEPAVAELAALFPNAKLAVLPGGGHFPWLDDPAWLTETIAAFLA